MKRFLGISVLCLFLATTFTFAQTSSYDQGTAYYQQGQYDQAAKAYEAAIQADPNNWRAYQFLGNCQYQQKQLAAALASYDKSLSLNPDNSSLKAFADSFRAKVAPAAPALPALPSVGASPNSNAQPMTEAPGTWVSTNGQGQKLLSDFYQAKQQEANAREGLKLYSETHPLTEDEKYVALFGDKKSSFYDPHFSFDFGIITPTVINVDIGLFLDPTTNLGAAFFYVPIPYAYESDTYDSSTGTYSYGITNIPGDLIYFEPRIKFYSAPSGLTTYQGFSFLYFGLHQGVEPDGYQNTNFDLFGLGYMFGFRTLPMDGLTMELGWKMGVAIIFVSEINDTYVYNSTTGMDTYLPQSTTSSVPFPYIIPEFRFGFTF